MDINTILYELSDDQVNFEDKLTLLFMIIGGIFFTLIIVTTIMSALNFQPQEFSPIF